MLTVSELDSCFVTYYLSDSLFTMSASPAFNADAFPLSGPAILSTKQEATIRLSCDFRDSGEMLDDSELRSGFAAVQLRKYIVPANDPSA